MTKKPNTPAEIKTFRAYEDGSGAEAVISYRGYVFACNYVGEAHLYLIRPVSGTRIENKIAADVCRKAYQELLQLNCSDEWFAKNRQMYSEVVAS